MSYLNDIVDLDEVLKDDPPTPGFSEDKNPDPGSASDDVDENSVNKRIAKDTLDGGPDELPGIDASLRLFHDAIPFFASEPDIAGAPCNPVVAASAGQRGAEQTAGSNRPEDDITVDDIMTPLDEVTPAEPKPGMTFSENPSHSGVLVTYDCFRLAFFV
jgi:hypothetical protein